MHGAGVVAQMKVTWNFFSKGFLETDKSLPDLSLIQEIQALN